CGTKRTARAGIVDSQIDWPERLTNVLRQLFNGARNGNVRGYGHGGSAGRLNQTGCLGDLIGRPGHHGYAHTCLSESQRESSSQAASGASDQRHLPLQIHPLKPLAVWLPDRPSARITGPPPVAPPASRRSTPADAPHRKPPPAPPLSSSPA